MAALQKAAKRFFSFIDFIERVIPTPAWMRYAALRLGTFIMTYLGTIGLVVVIFALSGVMLTFGAIFALLPFAIFIAIRISGALTHNKRPEE